MINRVVLVGRLVRDPELRRTNNGSAVASFTIAIDNRAKSGAEKTTSFIHNHTSTANIIFKYCLNIKKI